MNVLNKYKDCCLNNINHDVDGNVGCVVKLKDVIDDSFKLVDTSYHSVTKQVYEKYYVDKDNKIIFIIDTEHNIQKAYPDTLVFVCDSTRKE